MKNLRKEIENILYQSSSAKYFKVNEDSSLYKEYLNSVNKIVKILEENNVRINIS